MNAIGPNLGPSMDALVTCPACQDRRAAGPDCELCGGGRLVRRGTRERYLVEQAMRRPLSPEPKPRDAA